VKPLEEEGKECEEFEHAREVTFYLPTGFLSLALSFINRSLKWFASKGSSLMTKLRRSLKRPLRKSVAMDLPTHSLRKDVNLGFKTSLEAEDLERKDSVMTLNKSCDVE
jgi:hypothetical protein